VQESGRLALKFIEEDLRAAGFYGTGVASNSMTEAAVINQASSTAFGHFDDYRANAMRVFSRSAAGTWNSTLPADVPTAVGSEAKAGSDVLVVFYGDDVGATLTADVSLTQDVLIAGVTDCFKRDELAMLVGVSTAVIFQVTNIPACPGGAQTLQHATSANTSNSFQPYIFTNAKARVLKLRHRVYYVADSGRDNAAGEPIFSLYRVSDGAPQELVEGIEFLRLNLGERLTSGNIRYGDASAVSAAGIVTAHIGVLAQSLERARSDDDTRAYQLLDLSIDHDGSGIDHSGGRRLRRAFSSSVELRNRAQ
jgi:type IV pilus assembly protein PilW